MKELKISKQELNLLLDQSINRLKDSTMPGQEVEKDKSVLFLQKFKELFVNSQISYFPLPEIVALLVLENQVTQLDLKHKLKRSLLINEISAKITDPSETPNLPQLIKLFHELNNK